MGHGRYKLRVWQHANVSATMKPIISTYQAVAGRDRNVPNAVNPAATRLHGGVT